MPQFLESTKEQKEHIEKKKRRLDDDVERYKKKLHDLEKAFKVREKHCLAL